MLHARLAHPDEPGLVDRWRGLAEAAAEPNPFFEPEGALPAVRLLDGGTAVRVLVVEDRRGDATAPLTLALPVVAGRHRRLPARALSAWHHTYCFAGAALVLGDRAVDAWTAVVDLLDDSADLLVLPRTPVDGPSAQALDEALRSLGRSAVRTDAWERPVVVRRPDDSYLEQTLGHRSRKTLRRQRRRLENALGASVELVDAARDPVALQAAVEALLEVELSGWKGRRGTAMASHPRHAEHFREWSRSLAERGRLELWVLGTLERPAALQANIRAGRTVFHYKTTYDERYAAMSPGMQLELELVSAFHADPELDRIDSCTDPAPTPSARLYPDRQRLATVLVPSAGWRGRAVTAAAPAALGLLTAARDWRDRTRRKDAVSPRPRGRPGAQQLGVPASACDDHGGPGSQGADGDGRQH